MLKAKNPIYLPFIYLTPICVAVLSTYNSGGYLMAFPLVVIVLMLPIMIGLMRTKQLPIPNTMDIAVLIFTVWLGMSLFWTKDSYLSYLGFSRLSLLGIAYFSTRIILHHATSNHLSLFWRLIATVLLIFTCFPILEQFVMIQYARSGGLMHDPNVAAIIIVLPSLLLINQILFSQQKKSSYMILSMALFICFLSILCTESRSAILAFACCLIVLFSFSVKQQKFKAVIKHWGAIFSIALFATGINYAMGGGLLNRLAHITTEVTTNEDPRYFLFRGAIDIAQQHLPLGSGLLTFPPLYDQVREEPALISYYTHNDYLQLLAETGLVGLGLFLTLLGLCLFNCFKLFKQTYICTTTNSQNINLTSIPMPVCLWLLALFIQSLFYFVFYVSCTAVLAGIALACIQPDKQQHFKKVSFLNALKLLFIIPLILHIYNISVDSYYDITKPQLTTQHTNEAIADLKIMNAIKIHTNLPKLKLANAYWNSAVHEKNAKQQVFKLLYGLHYTCEYIKSDDINPRAYALLSSIYYGLEKLNQPKTKCPAPLPANKIEALQMAIKLAPFKSYKHFNTLIAWQKANGQQAQAKKTESELANILALIFDRKNQMYKEQAKQNSQYNLAAMQSQKQDLNDLKDIQFITDSSKKFFSKLFFDIHEHSR